MRLRLILAAAWTVNEDPILLLLHGVIGGPVPPGKQTDLICFAPQKFYESAYILQRKKRPT
jgi:hypothetical protein